ncbi:hypothetical protein L1887_24974 [Cichorium endivia]|nr:hypothetical protein L1887_24974 [Cichorium endivia]
MSGDELNERGKTEQAGHGSSCGSNDDGPITPSLAGKSDGSATREANESTRIRFFMIYLVASFGYYAFTGYLFRSWQLRRLNVRQSADNHRPTVQNYLRPGDSVILLHVRPTSALDPDTATGEELQQKLEDDFIAFTTAKSNDLLKPLVDAQINFKIHFVKDHDMKERLCLEACG